MNNKVKELKEKMTLHPIMTLLIMILITIVASGILSLIGFESTYKVVDSVTKDYSTKVVSVKSLLNMSGIKFIFSNTVKNFAGFTPLSTFIIILIGIGIMEKSGFLKTAFTLITKFCKKNTVTYGVIIISMVASIAGDIGYAVLLPLSALLFYYGKRNPLVGVIASFAGLTCGSGISLFLTSIDSSMLDMTIFSSQALDLTFTASRWSMILIMLSALIILPILLVRVTERIIAPKFGKYENNEEISISKRELRGLIIAIIVGILYILFFIYNIIPNVPFGGKLLDYTQTHYIDMLFSSNSFFSSGFVFIITFLFIILGSFYGIGARSIKNNKDFCENLGHSLDGIGNILVLILFASLFISIFKETNIGVVLCAMFSNIIYDGNFSGIPFILTLFILSSVSSIFLTSSVTRWTIMSGVVSRVAISSSMNPIFAQVIVRFAECFTTGLTPLLAYFVIYLALIEKYNQTDKPVSLFTSLKYIIPYSLVTGIFLLTLLLVFYIIGIPIGIGAFAGL